MVRGRSLTILVRTAMHWNHPHRTLEARSGSWTETASRGSRSLAQPRDSGKEQEVQLESGR